MKNESIDTSKYLQLTGKNKELVQKLNEIIKDIVEGNKKIENFDIDYKLNTFFDLLQNQGKNRQTRISVIPDIIIKIDLEGKI